MLNCLLSNRGTSFHAGSTSNGIEQEKYSGGYKNTLQLFSDRTVNSLASIMSQHLNLTRAFYMKQRFMERFDYY